MTTPRRRYWGFLADSARWDALRLRPDDIIISTPSKCGTTWMQNIVGMLVFGRPDLPAPLSDLSPWLDMQVRTTDEVIAHLDAQTHRRFIKTHTPLDGLPADPSVTYIAVFRHPLDVALSDFDHGRNASDAMRELRMNAVGDKDLGGPIPRLPDTDDPAQRLHDFIEGDLPPTGSGPNSLADMCEQLTVAWERRAQPNVHLFHYADLRADLDGEMRRVAAALGVDPAGLPWSDLVDAATLDSMRTRASSLAPDARLGLWRADRDFFRAGGRRNWADLLSAAEVAAFEEKVHDLAGPAAPWLLAGRLATP